MLFISSAARTEPVETCGELVELYERRASPFVVSLSKHERMLQGVSGLSTPWLSNGISIRTLRQAQGERIGKAISKQTSLGFKMA